VWKAPTIINYISPVLSTFRITYWLEYVSWDVYIIVYYISIFLIFFIIINFIYVAYCFKQRKFPFTWPVPLLKVSCNLIVTVLFIPLLGKNQCLIFRYRAFYETLELRPPQRRHLCA
jgi:hypothetical protein